MMGWQLLVTVCLLSQMTFEVLFIDITDYDRKILSWSLLALFNLILNVFQEISCKGNKPPGSLRIPLKVFICLA